MPGSTFNGKLQPLTVMVVDDHPALRAGLCSLIGSDPALRVLQQAASGEEAHAAYRSQRPDAVVMDLSMEGFGGIEAIRRIREIDPRAAILVYTRAQFPGTARAGARGRRPWLRHQGQQRRCPVAGTEEGGDVGSPSSAPTWCRRCSTATARQAYPSSTG
jgi:CheY-like chemotaxis protein